MGQKVHPVGYRLGVIYDWESRWYADGKKYAKFQHDDLEQRGWCPLRTDVSHHDHVAMESQRLGDVHPCFIHPL